MSICCKLSNGDCFEARGRFIPLMSRCFRPVVCLQCLSMLLASAVAAESPLLCRCCPVLEYLLLGAPMPMENSMWVCTAVA